MKHTQLMKGWPPVSRLGFGCMRFPVGPEGKIDRAQAREMIDYAYANGVNYYDTAYPYHGGESEDCLGEALQQYPRESYLLADKFPVWVCRTLEDAKAVFAKQLKRCRTDYFDSYLIHALDKNRWARNKELGIYQWLRGLKEQGVIRALGFSFHGEDEVFMELLDNYEWDFVQIQINYLDYVMIDSKRLYDKLCERGIPCFVMEPVRGGFLANLPETARAPMLAHDGGKTSAAEWALRWCISMENMPVILSGMSSLEQVKKNVEIFSEGKVLTSGELRMLEQTRDAIMNVKTIPCTGCSYCMDCPSGVDIPGVFRVYNEYKLFGDPFRSLTNYHFLGDEHMGDRCIRCGACAPLCPQGIDIPREAARAHDVLIHINSRWQQAIEE